jgi:hypothetical protein
MCSKNPWSLGIVENYRMINMDKLHDHVDSCDICSQYYNENIFKMLNRIIDAENQKFGVKEKSPGHSLHYHL